jgi:choline monooxygenase
MTRSLEEIIDSYRAGDPLTHASTIPSWWYVDPRVLELEHRAVFSRSWQVAGRADEVRRPGDYCSTVLPGGEPIAIVRGQDEAMRGFFNVCRHHAAAVITEPQGSATALRCPYHGWTYALDGHLIGAPDFAGICDFDRTANGLLPLGAEIWEKWIFVCLDGSLPLPQFLGDDLRQQFRGLGLGRFSFMERRHYTLDCNWKVFVDNYLDGGYHVPHLHRGLDSVLEYKEYTIENGERHCLQSSPIVSKTARQRRRRESAAERRTRTARGGERAFYYWIYPNFMINCYGDAMDTNLVIPRAIDRTEVIFDFYFTDVSVRARKANLASIAVSEEIQGEDVSICQSVQRGLGSRAYLAGRLSPRREAGEHLFHRLLHADLKAGLDRR